MSVRFMQLPGDLVPLADLLVETFQYPENPAWSVQTDERDQLVDSMKGLRRLWPLIRVIQAVSPALRDILRGVIWDEDDQPVGVVTVQRRGTTDTWFVGTVGVLPSHRRRGIARVLVQAALDLIREHDGRQAILTVIDGNVPACSLYEDLGFEHYGGDLFLHIEPGITVPEPNLPDGYVQERGNIFDWRPRYELEKRICPERLQRYEPVEEGRFRPPVMMRLLLPLIQFAQRSRQEDLVIRSGTGGEVVATGRAVASTRGKGPGEISARLDPNHSVLAPYLIRHLLRRVVERAPDQRVQFAAAQWMTLLVEAAEEAGMERRMVYRRMGLVL
jgi:GNAT superfamily N-acetyltransferase